MTNNNLTNNDGRLPELIAKWKAKAKVEEDDYGKRGEETKRRRGACAEVMKRVVEPVLKERADYLKRNGFRVEAGVDKEVSEPARIAYRFSFDYPGSPSVLINCDDECGVVVFFAKTVGRSDLEKREGWEKRWEVESLNKVELETELRLFCEEVIEHLVNGGQLVNLEPAL